MLHRDPAGQTIPAGNREKEKLMKKLRQFGVSF